MAKAILELEMPESCRRCKIAFCDIPEDDLYCPVTNKRTRITYYFDKRMADCPLKLVEENKLISTIGEIEKVNGIDNYFLHRNYHSGELELNITFKNDIADSILKDSGIQEIESSAFWE